jgi:hypothetical protein
MAKSAKWTVGGNPDFHAKHTLNMQASIHRESPSKFRLMIWPMHGAKYGKRPDGSSVIVPDYDKNFPTLARAKEVADARLRGSEKPDKSRVAEIRRKALRK